jgi:hypothetical protein
MNICMADALKTTGMEPIANRSYDLGAPQICAAACGQVCIFAGCSISELTKIASHRKLSSAIAVRNGG